MAKKTTSHEQGPGLTIRMYGHGLGDCFLLRYKKRDEKPVFILIDFGVLVGTPHAKDRMDQVLQDINKTTDGTIDLLVVTHEHWDHVSGFVQTDVMSELKFKQVWLAWTEQLGHPLADRLRREREEKRTRLRAAIRAMLANINEKFGADSEITEVRTAREELIAAGRVLDFFGPDPGERSQKLAADAADSEGTGNSEQTTEAAMEILKSLDPQYLSPGECRAVGESDLLAYVLGPPLDETLLKRDQPRKSRDEGYHLLSAFEDFAHDRRAFSSSAEEQEQSWLPFDRSFAISVEDARFDPFFRSHYGFYDDPLGNDGPDWRRIDYVWLEGASELALKLDNDTNNTSLALAFALSDGRTLIFPGDAQIGNWLSWADVKYERAGQPTVTGPDLLRRAIFYKVSHHCSHNATLKAGGLEVMTGSDLVAMIPVNVETATARRWKMPFPPLNDRLLEITHGRVLQADQTANDLDGRHRTAARQSLANRRWKQFRRNVTFAEQTVTGADHPLYVEYFVPLDD